MELQLAKSRMMYELCRRWLPGGVSRAGGFNNVLGYPLYVSRGKGARLWDVDGNEYLDQHLGVGAVMLGHGYAAVDEAVWRAVEMGAVCATESEVNVELARLLCDTIPCAEMVRFALAGTETTLHTLRLARAYTGKCKIVKFEGHFHGYHNTVMQAWNPQTGSVAPTAPGIPSEDLKYTIDLPFNDLGALERCIKDNKDDLAAIILEPINYNAGIIPRKEYIKAVRELTQENSIVLIFDEVLSAFRMCKGGAQEYLGVTPDLCCLGKALANGYPLSAFAGRREIMEHLMPVGDLVHSGTYTGNQVSVAAGLAAVKEYTREGFYDHINDLANRLYRGYEEIFEDLGVKARVQGLGARFVIFFGIDTEVTNLRETLRRVGYPHSGLMLELMKRGVYLPGGGGGHSGICAAYTREDIDTVLDKTRESLKVVLAAAPGDVKQRILYSP